MSSEMIQVFPFCANAACLLWCNAQDNTLYRISCSVRPDSLLLYTCLAVHYVCWLMSSFPMNVKCDHHKQLCRKYHRRHDVSTHLMSGFMQPGSARFTRFCLSYLWCYQFGNHEICLSREYLDFLFKQYRA